MIEKTQDIGTLIENQIETISFINAKLGITFQRHPAAFAESCALKETIRLSSNNNWYKKILEYGITCYSDINEDTDPVNLLQCENGHDLSPKEVLAQFLNIYC